MSATESNDLELHYWLIDKSHSMNAFVLNKSEWELLHLIEEISKELNIDINIEALAIREGGLIQRLKVLNKNFKAGTISNQLLILIVTAIIGTPLSVLSTQLILKLFKDNKQTELNYQNTESDIELKKAEIRKLNAEANLIENELKEKQEKGICDKIVDSIKENQKISKRTSNFYEELLKENKISCLTISYTSKDKSRTEMTIERSDFDNFVIKENELEPIVDELAIIEIISPVLKKGNYQWRGIYNGEALNFNMKSNEFKSMVQSGSIEFKNGACISCVLKMDRRIDDVGNEIITAYNIENVIGYFVNDKIIETSEGKMYNKKKKATKAQLNFEFKEEEQKKL